MAEKRTPRVEELFQKLNQYETDENGNPVSWASLHRNEFIAELMALDKSEFDLRNDTCMGLYLPACIIGTNDVLLTDKFLKATELNLNTPTPDNVPLLHNAQTPKMMKYLIDMGADINATDNYGTLLMKMASYGNLEGVRFLAEKGAKLNTVSKEFGMTAAHAAALSGNVEVLKYLASKGCDMTKKDKEGKTPLYYAKYEALDYCDKDCIKFLQEYETNQVKGKKAQGSKKTSSKKKASSRGTTKHKGRLKGRISASSDYAQTEQIEDETTHSASMLARLNDASEKVSKQPTIINRGKEIV